jgi:hypothetical protein
MTLQTKLPGSLIQSGSVPVSAITNFTGQLTASLPTGTVSSSAQVTAFLPSDTVSSSVQVTAFLPVGTVSSSTQLPSGIASSSAQVIAYLPSDTVSSSTQVTAFLPTNTVSSSGQVTAFLPTGTVSSSGQVGEYPNIATTGSNTFVGIQTISNTTNSTSYLDGALTVAGGMSVRKDVRISGSMTINGLLTAVSMSTQYVTSSEYTIGTSKVILNDDDNVRFSGLSIVDSGSSSPTTASIFWDSLQHRFIYENLSGSSYNSSIIIAGPKHTGSLGDEPTLTSGYIPYATGTDHIDNSVIYQSGSNIGIGTTSPGQKLDVTGNIRVSSYYFFNGNPSNPGDTTAAMYDGAGVGPTINGLNFAIRTGATPAERLRVDASGLVGIGTTNPARALHIAGTGVGSEFIVEHTGMPANNRKFNIAGNTSGGASGTWDIRTLNDALNAATKVFFSLDNATGNIGIGTTSPGYKLDINTVGGSTATTRLYGNDQSNVRLRLENVGSGGRTWELVGGLPGANNSNFSLYDVTGTATRLTVNSSGNVGIGTTNPSNILHLHSDSGIYSLIRGANANLASNLAFNHGGGGGRTGVNGQWNISFGSAETNFGATPNLAGGLAFWHQDDGGTINDVMRLKTDKTVLFAGNVGIGSTSPVFTLDSWSAGAVISGTATIGSNMRGVRIYNTNTATNNNAVGLWFSTGPHQAGIASFRATADTTWETTLAFYTHVDTTSALNDATEKMRITGNGNVGIGTTSPEGKFDTYGTGYFGFQNYATQATQKVLVLRGEPVSGVYAQSRFNFYTIPGTTVDGVAKLQIKSQYGSEAESGPLFTFTGQGGLLLGSTDAGYSGGTGLWLRGNIATFQASRSADPAVNLYRLTSNGDILTLHRDSTQVGSISVTTSATAYNTSSDRRLKDNIAPADDAGSIIDAIAIVKHDWKVGGSVRYGVIAQDIYEVVPETVRVGDTDNEITEAWAVDYSKFVPMLIKEIQTLRHRITQLENQ